MSVTPHLRQLFLTMLLPVCLSGCSPEKDELVGYWQTDEPDCLSLCAFIISSQPDSKDWRLQFDDDSDIGKEAKGLFQHESGNAYRLVFSSGGKVGFTLSEGKLVAEEGSVFEKRP